MIARDWFLGKVDFLVETKEDWETCKLFCQSYFPPSLFRHCDSFLNYRAIDKLYGMNKFGLFSGPSFPLFGARVIPMKEAMEISLKETMDLEYGTILRLYKKEKNYTGIFVGHSINPKGTEIIEIRLKGKAAKKEKKNTKLAYRYEVDYFGN